MDKEKLINDLKYAYSRVKADVYYSSFPCLFQLAEYEEHLEERITRLAEVLIES